MVSELGHIDIRGDKHNVLNEVSSEAWINTVCKNTISKMITIGENWYIIHL